MLDLKFPVKNTHKSGVIPSLNGKSFPKHLLFIDTETYIEQYDDKSKFFPLRLGIAIYIELTDNASIKIKQVYKFKTTDEFISILNKCVDKDHTLHVFAHNIKFDIMVLNLPLHITSNGYKSFFPIINERMFLWRVFNKRYRILFLDTANFGVSSVQALGKEMGFNKLEIDFNSVSDGELFIYCERDCEILSKFILSYIDFIISNNLGSFKHTLASQAFTTFRTKFYKSRITCHNHEMVLKLEREAYHGGRVECFYIGDYSGSEYYFVDVNSMYLHIMQTSELPTKLIDYYLNPTKLSLYKRMKRYYNIADVLINTSEPAYPLYDRNKLLFPIGSFRTTLHHTELDYAIKNNDIVNVYSVASYHKALLFNDYALFFYMQRLENREKDNNSWAYISKLFGNSLYGKFGQSGHYRQNLPDDNTYPIKRLSGLNIAYGLRFTEVYWYGSHIREFKYGEATYSSPAIAGAITANARMLLYNLILKAGLDNVYYCDTDSLIVNLNGYNNLSSDLSESILGKLKLEEKTSTLILHNAKDYVTDTRTKIKGVPKNSKLLSRNKWQYEQFEGFITWLNEGGNRPPKLFTLEKSRRTAYDKGWYDNEKDKVNPFYYVYNDK